MLLYGSTDSGHSYKVRLFLLLAGVPHRYEWVDLAMRREDRPENFRAASRFGEVPVLVDGDRVFCQSNAILMQLARETGRLAGAQGEWQDVVEWLSWEANRVGFSVPNLRFARRWAPQPPQVLAYLNNRAATDLATLDSFLAQRRFLVGSGPSIADLSCSAYLYWLDEAGLSLAPIPNVARWLDDLRALPSWRHPDEAMRADASADAS